MQQNTSCLARQQIERERESKSSRTSYRRCSSDKVALEGNTHESKERGGDIATHPPEKELRLS